MFNVDTNKSLNLEGYAIYFLKINLEITSSNVYAATINLLERAFT